MLCYSSVNTAVVYVEGIEPEDSLAQGIIPIAPTVDRGGIPGVYASTRRQMVSVPVLFSCPMLSFS